MAHRRVASITKMPSADEFDTCEPASQQTQYCKSTDVDLTHGCEDAAPAQGDHRQRHGHARPELPPRGRSVPRLAAQRAVAAVQARGAERPERLLARASAASPIDRVSFTLARAGPRRGRGAARPRGNWDCQTPARHRRVLRRRGFSGCPGAFYSAATEGRRRLVEEEEVAAALEEEGVLMCVHRVRKGGFRACYVRVRSRGLLRALLQNGHGFPVRRLRIIIPKVPAPRVTATHLLRASLREDRPGARLPRSPELKIASGL